MDEAGRQAALECKATKKEHQIKKYAKLVENEISQSSKLLLPT